MRIVWMLFIIIPFLASSEGFAQRRRGWSTQATTQGQSSQSYYRPAVQANQQYGVRTQSGCVHGPDGSSCQHRYEVQRRYQNQANGQPASEGQIRYQGGEESQYYHQGQPYQLQGIDQIESAKAVTNKESAWVLNEISRRKADIQLNLVQIQEQLRNGDIPRAQHDRLVDLETKYNEVLDTLAKAVQQRQGERFNYYVKLSVQQLWSLSGFQEEYDRAYNPGNLRRTQEVRQLLGLWLASTK